LSSAPLLASSETLPIELGANSLILWVYDVLMNDKGGFWNVEVSLTGTMMQVLSLPPAKEDAVPVSGWAVHVRSLDRTGYRFAAAMSRHATGGFSLPMCETFHIQTSWEFGRPLQRNGRFTSS
jgi:hypothetical protein